MTHIITTRNRKRLVTVSQQSTLSNKQYKFTKLQPLIY